MADPKTVSQRYRDIEDKASMHGSFSKSAIWQYLERGLSIDQDDAYYNARQAARIAMSLPDLRHAHVAYDISGQHYLGTVIDTYRLPELTMLRVNHFNGDNAPDVPIYHVTFLERTWEATS